MLTLLRVWDCPTSISTFEASMDMQKFTKMMDLSERMYLRIRKQKNLIFTEYLTAVITSYLQSNHIHADT